MMKIFKNFLKEKKQKMTVDAFDTIVDNKKEKVLEFINDNKMEVAVGAGVMAGLIVLGCLKMRHSSSNPETVVIVINNQGVC